MFYATVFPNDLVQTIRKLKPYMHLGPEGFEFTTSTAQEYVPIIRPLELLIELGSCIRCHKEKLTKRNLNMPSVKGRRENRNLG